MVLKEMSVKGLVLVNIKSCSDHIVTSNKDVSIVTGTFLQTSELHVIMHALLIKTILVNTYCMPLSIIVFVLASYFYLVVFSSQGKHKMPLGYMKSQVTGCLFVSH